MTSSGVSQLSRLGGSGRSFRATAAVAVALGFVVLLAGWWCFANGYILYYGDAESHLNISRAIVDSRTPGYDQLGTVWLPALHVMCVLFAKNDWLWTTGLAGSIPVALCFVIAGTCFYLAAHETYGSTPAALVAVACFALNPNVLYLAVIPMTEIVFMAALSVALLAALRFGKTQEGKWFWLALAASWALSLTRYDGWFLIPFLGWWLSISAKSHKLLHLLAFGFAASLAPAYWVAHNWWETGNAFDFINGTYSPVAIQQSKPYPGYRDWIAAAHYYATAGQLCAGGGLILLGVAGTRFAVRYRLWTPLLFLLLTPLFYIWSMHSSGGTPIYVPSLWPHSYYNSRYGIAVLPLCAFAAGSLVLAIPQRWRKLSAALPVIAIAPWLSHPSPQSWICWKESQVNSLDRRAWTAAAVRILGPSYTAGQGILTSTGDVTGIYRSAGIHLTETLNIGNGPQWFLATTRPDLFHPNVWLVMQRGDALSRMLAHKHAPYSDLLSITTTKFSPPLSVARRDLP